MTPKRLLAGMLLLLASPPLRAGDADINPFLPAVRTDADHSLLLLRNTLDQKDYPAAATALNDWCTNRETPLIPAADAWWLSPQTWLATLPDDQLAPLRAAYRARLYPDARAALDSLKSNPAAGPEEFALLAAQYPLSSVAALAHAEAADRAWRLADPWTAAACYALAQRAGLEPDPRQARNLDACRRLIASLPSPQSAPFDAIWYGQPEAIAQPRYLPLLAGRLLYIAGPRDLIALSDQGHLSWTWGFSEKNPRPIPRGQDRGRGPIIQPAALVTAAGPQILVVRQRRPDSADYILRGFRAADGRPLWSTDEHKSLQALCFAATPAIAGRYVYGIAKDYSQSSPRIVLLALGVTDGRPLWQTTLGALPNPTQRTTHDRRDEDEDSTWGWDDFFEQTEPAVAGDLLLIAPNTGCVMALDRFAGQLRWMRSYPKNRAVQADGDRPAPRVLPPADLTEILRWRNTPVASGAVALFAPQDTPETFTLKAASGELLWRSHALSGFTLLGIHNSLAIFAGPSVQAVDITTNKTAWQYRPSKNQPITGPAALIGAYVHVPTGGGLVSLRADSGAPAPQAPQPPNLAALTRSDMLRPTLERADIAFTFDLPEPDTLKVGNLTLKLPTGPVPPAVADAFATFAPGWRLANCGDQNQPGLLKEYLGRSPVFVTHPLDANTPCTIARILRLPKDRRVALKLRAAHAPKSDWRLVVKVNGKQEIDRIIDHAATADNWFRSYVELAPYAGQQIMIELIHYPTAWANESAYWGPLVFENR